MRIGKPGLQRRRAPVLSAVLLAALAAAFLSLAPLPRSRLPARQGEGIAQVGSWGYQLQRARAEAIAGDIDLLVIDHSADGTASRVYTPAEVAAFQRRPDGRRRIVLAYLSIGEAESYRYYWSPAWRTSPPRWLGPENKDWRRNYLVRFWDPDWQRQLFVRRPKAVQRAGELLLGWPEPYLDRIIEAGFDGVYLDRVDAWESWKRERPGADADMVALVKRLAAYARGRRPGFLVVPQNAEELLANPDYRAAIDAVAKEDLLYGIGGDGVRNSDGDVDSAVADLAKARAAGLPVLVVEYLADADQRFEAAQRLRQLGFIPQFAVRQLNAAPETEQQAPAALPAIPPDGAR